MNKTGIKCIQCSCKSAPFRELTQDELIAVNKSKVEIIFRKGETIFKQGSIASNIAFIRKGLVKVISVLGDKELVLALEPCGKFIGIQSLYSNNLHHFSAVACEDVLVCLIDINAIRAVVLSNARFGAELLRQFNEDILFSYDRMKCLTLKQLSGRFADLLLCLSLRIYKRKKFSIPLTKKELSTITNMSQESLSRVIKDFTSEKIIEYERNEITILNFAKIKHISQVG